MSFGRRASSWCRSLPGSGSFGLASALVVTLLLLAGCGGPDGSDAAEADPPASPPSSAEIPADRNQAAVLAALTQLDSCALLDAARAEAPGFPAELEAGRRAPHDCAIENEANDKVIVTLGMALDAQKRYQWRLKEIDGVKAYLNGSTGSCDVLLPVSFTQAIQFHASAADADGAELCGRAEAFAAAALVVLAKPEGARAQLPLARWDACSVLSRVLGGVPVASLKFGGSLSGLDRCNGPDSMLTLDYGSELAENGSDRFRTINDRPVREVRLPQCRLTWDQDLSGLPDTGRRMQQITVEAADCDRAEELAAAAMKVLVGAAPERPAPQRPLVYRIDEADVPAAGACADLAPGRQCVPYHQVDVPTGGGEVLSAAEADPNVNCAVALEAVRKHLGPTLRPVTSSSFEDGRPVPYCAFVAPDRAVQVQVSISADPLPSGESTEQLTHPESTTIAELPAVEAEILGTEPGGAVFVSTAGGGRLLVKVLFPVRRGSSKAVRDEMQLAKLEPLTADIISKYF